MMVFEFFQMDGDADTFPANSSELCEEHYKQKIAYSVFPGAITSQPQLGFSSNCCFIYLFILYIYSILYIRTVH